MSEADNHFSAALHFGFVPERGIGQGESASSLMWTALYDMLLEWIDPANLMTLHSEEEMLPEDIAIPNYMTTIFADDLATAAMGTTASYWQQRQADWLSAFCAFTGLQLHPDKIVIVELGPANPD
jgi:hypothetical protein